MFVPKTSLFHSQNLAKKEHLSKVFGVFCWNVYKQTLNKKFEPLMLRLLQENPADIILFQEAKIKKGYSALYNSKLPLCVCTKY